MLETVRSYLHSQPHITFYQFYQQFVMQAQDSTLDREITAISNDLIDITQLTDVESYISNIQENLLK